LGGFGDTARVSRFGDVYENRVTGERAVVLRGEEAGPEEPALVHLTVKPGGAVAGEHFHPHVEERFRVVSGTLGTRVDGVERTLSAGEEATVRAGIPHDWWNAGETEAGVLVELTPADPRFEEMIATLFGLANAGRTNAKGMPDPFQLALIGREFADVIRFTKPPPAVQKVLFAVLGAVGRMRGYKGVYPEYLQPHGRATPDPDVVALAAQAAPPRAGAHGERG
jgi:mannose-6-phosphate isomerase-like protein (cupin superfamily)